MPRKARPRPAGDTAGDTLGDTLGTQQSQKLEDKGEKFGYAVAELRRMIAAPETPAAAKATMLRTLAEIEGQIGRHQQAPEDRAADRRVSALTRAELERELTRLRAKCGVSPRASH